MLTEHWAPSHHPDGPRLRAQSWRCQVQASTGQTWCAHLCPRVPQRGCPCRGVRTGWDNPRSLPRAARAQRLPPPSFLPPPPSSTISSCPCPQRVRVLGQGLNLHRSSEASQGRDDAGSLIRFASRRFPSGAVGDSGEMALIGRLPEGRT